MRAGTRKLIGRVGAEEDPIHWTLQPMGHFVPPAKRFNVLPPSARWECEADREQVGVKIFDN